MSDKTIFYLPQHRLMEPQKKTLYLISESVQRGISNVFRIAPNTKTPIALMLFHRPNPEMEMLVKFRMPIFFEKDPRFPLEIVLMIMHEVIQKYLTENAMGKVMKIICSSRYMIEDYFDRYCGREGNLTLVQKHQRLSRSLKFASALTYQYSRMFEFDIPQTLVMTEGIIGRNRLIYPPWDIDFESILFDDVDDGNCHFYIDGRRVKMIRAGQRFRDIVMMHGNQKDPFFHGTKIQTPVFIFALYENDNLYAVPHKNWNEARAWFLFAQLLVRMNGPHTGVYCVRSTAAGTYVSLKSLTEF